MPAPLGGFPNLKTNYLAIVNFRVLVSVVV